MLLAAFTPVLSGPATPVPAGAPFPVTLRAAGANGPVTWTLAWRDAGDNVVGTAGPYAQPDAAVDRPVTDLVLPSGTYRLTATAVGTADNFTATAALGVNSAYGPGGVGRYNRPGAGLYAMAAAPGGGTTSAAAAP